MTAVARPASLPQKKQRLRLWIRLLRTTRAIEADLRERLRVQFAMTLPQFDVLATLYREGNGMTMTELSRRLMVSNGNVTGIVDRLVAEKYVLRQAPAQDRRSFNVRLTPTGATRFAAVAAAQEQLAVAQANASKTQTLFGYTRITAPFAGVIRG